MPVRRMVSCLVGQGNEKEITVIAIPRDTMTEIEMFDQSGKSLGKTTDHISLSYAYGDGKDQTSV